MEPTSIIVLVSLDFSGGFSKCVLPWWAHRVERYVHIVFLKWLINSHLCLTTVISLISSFWLPSLVYPGETGMDWVSGVLLIGATGMDSATGDGQAPSRRGENEASSRTPSNKDHSQGKQQFKMNTLCNWIHNFSNPTLNTYVSANYSPF